MTPVPVGVQRLAAQLANRMPWLVRGRHIGALARLLHRHHLSTDTGWNADRVLRIVELQNRATGHRVPDPAQQRNPLGYLNTLLTASTQRLATHPPVVAAPKPVAAWRIEDAERRRQIAAEDPAEIAAAIAALRAQMTTPVSQSRPNSRRDPRPLGRSTSRT